MSNEKHNETTWSVRARGALDLYRDDLLRRVAAKLIRPRTTWHPNELRERMQVALDDPVSVDRTLKPLSPVARQLLRLIATSGQPRWAVRAVADVLPAIGHLDGIGPLIELLESGLAYPELENNLPVESFESWLAPSATVPRDVFVMPVPAERCRVEPLHIAMPEGEKNAKLLPVQADGLEFLLRLAVLWQSVRDNSLRLTQAGDFFKRDLDRLREHPLLSSAPTDAPAAVADPALFVVDLARAVGVLQSSAEMLTAGELPASWSKNLASALMELWPALFTLRSWDPLHGHDTERGRTFLQPVGVMLAVALQSMEPGQWIGVGTLATWLTSRSEDWNKSVEDWKPWAESFLLGVLQPMRFVEATRNGDRWFVRLTELGRNVVGGAAAAVPPPALTQTLLVQPNLEVVLYRQGLTPELILQLTQFAEWRLLGLACTLVLTADSVYRGLESGTSLAELQRLLERHSTRELSDSVLDTLRSWASKRERVQVYTAAVLLEFRTAGELDQAMKQGIVEVRVTDRIGLVSSDAKIDYSRFRLVGTRDYMSPEERCVEVGDDGLSMTVQDGRADLLLGAELRRFAEPIDAVAEDRSRYRATLDSLRAARRDGVDVRWLDDWFARRAGQSVPATTRLLFQGSDAGGAQLERWVVLRLASEEAADGVEHWPAAQALIAERLGATTFAVSEENVEALKTLFASAELTVDG